MGRRRSTAMGRRHYLLATLVWACCQRVTVVFVSGFSIGLGDTSFTRPTLAAGGGRTVRARGVRRRRQEIILPEAPTLSSEGGRRAPFAGQAPALTTLDWRDLGPEVGPYFCLSRLAQSNRPVTRSLAVRLPLCIEHLGHMIQHQPSTFKLSRWRIAGRSHVSCA